jgi:hypothetical protein
VEKKSMSQCYEEKREAIVFGSYLRMHENGLWKHWHDAIQNDPGLEAEMYDYFKMKEWVENKKWCTFGSFLFSPAAAITVVTGQFNKRKPCQFGG